MLVYMWMTQLAQPLAGVCMQIAGPGDNKFHMKFIFYRARNCPEGSKE